MFGADFDGNEVDCGTKRSRLVDCGVLLTVNFTPSLPRGFLGETTVPDFGGFFESVSPVTETETGSLRGFLLSGVSDLEDALVEGDALV